MVSEYIIQNQIGKRRYTDIELTDNFSKAKIRRYTVLWERLNLNLKSMDIRERQWRVGAELDLLVCIGLGLGG